MRGRDTRSCTRQDGMRKRATRQWPGIALLANASVWDFHHHLLLLDIHRVGFRDVGTLLALW